jgi:GNAT superfamily N-acetyltransferase
MSLYADYLKERTDDHILETYQGFATYRFLNEKQCYIIDIYVAPDYRYAGVASEMADVIAGRAKGKGCTELLGTVNPTAKGSTESLKVLIQYGMKLHSSSDNVIVFKKDI